MATLVRNPYQLRRDDPHSAAARRQAAAAAGGERMGRPSRGAQWDVTGEDPAEVAEEAGGYLA
eukprot:2850271-Alexandrium_andersonii.AAC.1